MRISRIVQVAETRLVLLENGRAYAWSGDWENTRPSRGEDLGSEENLPLAFPVSPGKIIGLGANYAVGGEKIGRAHV